MGSSWGTNGFCVQPCWSLSTGKYSPLPSPKMSAKYTNVQTHLKSQNQSDSSNWESTKISGLGECVQSFKDGFCCSTVRVGKGLLKKKIFLYFSSYSYLIKANKSDNVRPTHHSGEHRSGFAHIQLPCCFLPVPSIQHCTVFRQRNNIKPFSRFLTNHHSTHLFGSR